MPGFLVPGRIPILAFRTCSLTLKIDPLPLKAPRSGFSGGLLGYWGSCCNSPSLFFPSRYDCVKQICSVSHLPSVIGRELLKTRGQSNTGALLLSPVVAGSLRGHSHAVVRQTRVYPREWWWDGTEERREDRGCSPAGSEAF